MMKRIVLILSFVFAINTIYAQNFSKRNTIMVESNFILSLSVSYDRIIPIQEKLAVMVGGDYLMGVGFGYGSHWVAPETSLLFFGPKHFLETGVQYVFSVSKNDDEYEDENQSPGLRFAYRFQSKNGLTLRATTNILFNIDPIFIPTIGVGYSF